MTEIEKIAVIGFGTMGQQISQLFAQNGFSVVARDIDSKALQFGLEQIRRGRFGLEGAVERGKLTHAVKEVMNVS